MGGGQSTAQDAKTKPLSEDEGNEEAVVVPAPPRPWGDLLATGVRQQQGGLLMAAVVVVGGVVMNAYTHARIDAVAAAVAGLSGGGGGGE